jgi:hypothetical protein
MSTENNGSILWFIDLSAPPEQAFKDIEKYKSEGKEVHIYYIGNDVSSHPSWYGNFEPVHGDKIHEKASRNAEKRLDQICGKYLSGCPYYVRHTHIGDYFEDVFDILSKESFDMAVFSKTANSEDSGLSRLIEEIEKRTDIPVKVIN